MRRIVPAFILLACVSLNLACSQKKLSDQERRRQQEVLTGDKIRADLEHVKGEYEGTLESTSSIQKIRLNLFVRDVPVPLENEPDPVLTPKLVGNLRIIYSEETGEYIDAPIKASEYFKINNKLNIVVNHSQFGDLTFNYVVNGAELNGTWSAPMLGANGNSKVIRK